MRFLPGRFEIVEIAERVIEIQDSDDYEILQIPIAAPKTHDALAAQFLCPLACSNPLPGHQIGLSDHDNHRFI
jgi:hypothetical protein